MITVHGIWVDGALRVWGEDPGPVPDQKTRRGRRRSIDTPRAHPFAVPDAELYEALGVPGIEVQAQQGELGIYLPSDSRGPLPSPELLIDGQRLPSGGRRLELWTVPALILDSRGSLDFLTSLPWPTPSRIIPGSTLRFWSEAGGLALELLVRQRFVPGLYWDGNCPHARWQVLLDTEDIEDRVALLARSCPPACRAFRNGGDPPGSLALVRDFLSTMVDAFVRHQAGSSDRLGEQHGEHRGGKREPERSWFSALASPDPRILGHGKQMAGFLRALDDWTGQLVTGVNGAPFRTCFRLEPPPGRSGSESKAGAVDRWTLSFHLQARDDRSVLVEAGQVWKTRSRAATFLKRQIRNPQEFLLRDLGRASKLFPALEKALAGPRPSGCDMSTEEAYRFLREGVPVLEQGGFGVLVPPWWQKPDGKLGVRMDVKPASSPKDAGMGMMGLDSLVNYQWQVTVGDESLTADEFDRLVALKVPLVRVRGKWVEIRPGEIETAIKFFDRERHGTMTLGEAVRIGLGSHGSDTGLPVVEVEASGWIREFLAGASDSTLDLLPQPGGFTGQLRPYQVRGFSWLSFLDRMGLGACLADDMGLGKTIQVIALLLHERDGSEGDLAPTLLICPMSVVGNWQREVTKFAPSLRVMVHHGPERLTGDAFAREAGKHDVVISTYGLTHRDRKHLALVRWGRVCIDEAQNIKNPSARQSQAVRSLRAYRRIALTGTPVENRLSDLWSIMEFLNPRYLGSARDFQRTYAIPIQKHRNLDRAERLRMLVQPFVLRRLKTDRSIISDLPEKMEMKVYCNLTREQASLYQAVVDEMLGAIDGAEGVKRKGLVLASLTRLKQICNHPALFLQDRSDLQGRSGKLSRLVDMLEEVLAVGDRALVFTQFADMGKLIRTHLQEELGCQVLFLHGATPRRAREDMVRRFQGADGAPPVFILSLKAGGVGLNLTGASHVFHFDRWWNPAVEDQATDRAFRIGQRKNVQVHKYVCAGTLEERIDQMIEAKKDLAESVVGIGEDWLTELSTAELRSVLSLSADAVGEE